MMQTYNPNQTQYQNQYPYPPCQPTAQQFYYNPMLNSVLPQLLQVMQEVMIQQGRLNQLSMEREYQQERAYSEITNENNHYCVSDKNGNKHAILGAVISAVFYLQFDDLYEVDPCYILSISKASEPLVLSAEKLSRPNILLCEIARVSGHNIRQFKSSTMTADLLRTFIASRAQSRYIPFYQGWQLDKGTKQWSFVFANGTTHGSRSPVPCDCGKDIAPFANLTPSSGLQAAEQFIQLMSIIKTPGIRTIVCRWFHAAALASLLTGIGYRIPMGLCFYSIDSRINRYLEHIFSWFGDSTIPMSMSERAFRDAMVERKDQPCLFRDKGDYSENSKIFLNSLCSGKIEITSKRVISSPDLGSLPTVLSDSTSVLSISPNFATIEIDSSDFFPITEKSLSALSGYISDYVFAFNTWISSHVSELHSQILRGIDEVYENKGGNYKDFNEESVTTLGVLLGIRRIVGAFFLSLAPNQAMNAHMREPINPAHVRILETALSCASNSYCNADDLASAFLNTVASMRSRNEFDWRPATHAELKVPCKKGKAGIVYENDTSIGFTRQAFMRICGKCGVSSPQLLRALHDAGFRKCPLASQASKQNRMTVYDLNEAKERVYVYLFDSVLISQDW